MDPHGEQPHLPGPSVYPVGFAIGVACLLVGIIISWLVAAVGAAIAIVFAFLWIRDVAGKRGLTEVDTAPEVTVETVAGITAMQDLASRAGISLAEGTELVTLVPLNKPPRIFSLMIPTTIGMPVGISAGSNISLIADPVTMSIARPDSGREVPSMIPGFSRN